MTAVTLEQIAARVQTRIAKGGLTAKNIEVLEDWSQSLLEWHDDDHTPDEDQMAALKTLLAQLDELDRRDAPAPVPAPAGGPIAAGKGKGPAKVAKVAVARSGEPAVDLEQAARFIAALTGKRSTAVTFQTFDDGPKPPRPGLVQVLHGTLDQRAETLTELNGRGAGVYITINTTDGTGRKAKNITGIRALFADFDATDAVERVLAATRKLAPSIVVESSPGKRHLYWLAEGVEVKDAAGINKALAAEVGADKVHDIARVLRLPGFFHRKGAPVMSRLLETHPEHRYSGAQVVKAFGLNPGEPSAASDVHAPAAGLDGVLSDQQVADARAVIAAMREKKMHLSAKGRGVKEGTGLWHQVVGSLAPYGKLGAQLAREFSEGDPTYSPALVVSTIKTKLNNGATGIGNLFKLAEAHGIANPAAGRNAGASFDAFYSEVPQEVRPVEPTVEPLEWPPGVVGEIASYILESSRLPVPSFAIAGALTAASYLVQNLSRVAPSDTPLNLYQVLIGGTGRGKEDPRKAIKRIVNSPELTHLSAGISESMSSGSALLRALSHAPRALILSDEYGMFMQSAMQGRDDHRRDLVKELMTLYGQGSSFYAGKVYADTKNNIERIDFPYVVVLGTTTEEELFAGMNMLAINNGSANRNIYVYADAADPKPNRRPCTAIPPALSAKLADLFGAGGARSSPLEYGPGAEELVAEFGDNLPKTGVFANLWSRAEENAIRVAGVLAVCGGRVITASHVRWAIKYIQASIEQFAGKSEHQISESDFHKSSNRVLGFIAAPMKYSDDKQFSSFTRRGLMPKGKLLKLTHMRARDLDDVLTALLESQQIASNKQDGSTVFWVGNSQPVEETPTQ